MIDTTVAERGLERATISPPLGITVVTLTSAVVLVVEIIAARMIAPYVGVTLESMSAVIGVILAGIAAGAALGGRLGDRVGAGMSPLTLVARILCVGGLALYATPFVVGVVGPRLDATARSSAVLLTAAAFLVPCAVLSAAGPVVLAELGTDRTRLARVAGRVSAFGTAGALLGNFGAGYVLVARFRSDAIVFGAATVVVAVGVGLLVGERVRPAVRIGAVGLVAVASVTGAATADAALPCSTETRYVCLTITPGDHPTEVLVRSNVYSSSFTDLADPNDLRLNYARDVAGVIDVAVTAPDRFFSIGGGGYTIPLHLADRFPAARHDVAEIDPELARAVTEVLDLDLDDERIRTIVGDARVVLTHLDDRYDVVLGDAFNGLSVPWHLTTVEFLRDVRARLTPDGIYVVNLLDSGSLDFVRAQVRTLQAVFPDVVVLLAPGASDGDSPVTNVVVAAGRDLPPADLVEVAVRNRGSASIALDPSETSDLTAGAPLLTDEFAPVDQLIGRD